MSFLTRLINTPILLILFIIFLGVLTFKYFRKMFITKPIGNAKEGFKWVIQRYGVEYAKQLEQMFRKETAHFKSGQWLRTGTAGMEARSKKFPYGWNSLKEYANKNGLNENDFFLVQMTDNHDGRKPYFIGFKETKNSIKFTAWFIFNKRGGDIVSWYRLPSDETREQRKNYFNSMLKITPRIVNELV
ncbi:MAG: hypothetical protein ACK5B9_03215 [Flavobacteriia bacterium]